MQHWIWLLVFLSTPVLATPKFEGFIELERGTSFDLPKNSYRAFKVSEECTTFFYGPAKVTVTEDALVKIHGTSQWVCSNAMIMETPAGPLEIEEGSLLKMGDRVFVSKGTVITKKGSTLENNILYQGRATGWSRVQPQPTAAKIAEWKKIYPDSIPENASQDVLRAEPKIDDKEEERLAEEKRAADEKEIVRKAEETRAAQRSQKTIQRPEPRPPGVYKGRFAFTGLGGMGSISTPKNDYNSDGTMQVGGRFWANFKSKDSSWLITAERSFWSGNGTLPQGRSSLDSTIISVGKRWNHQEAFSFYWLAGSGFMYWIPEKEFSSYSVKRDRLYMPLNLSAGVTYEFFHDRTFRIFTALEAVASYGLIYIDEVRQDRTAPTAADNFSIKGSPILLGGSFLIGPAIGF